MLRIVSDGLVGAVGTLMRVGVLGAGATKNRGVGVAPSYVRLSGTEAGGTFATCVDAR
jgi:hypothetical protein